MIYIYTNANVYVAVALTFALTKHEDAGNEEINQFCYISNLL